MYSNGLHYEGVEVLADKHYVELSPAVVEVTTGSTGSTSDTGGPAREITQPFEGEDVPIMLKKDIQIEPGGTEHPSLQVCALVTPSQYLAERN
jgi:hypothetical protein